ncbi:hypothetical protein N7452_001131 [Penicillium brevicompactum]|uniref:Uncharacterized protein n=1 Tax=Penicillium brevicompactum TaxID=5074 RepID=A0A9W9R1R8_PENBR|nr:hypothetical protein N7452_001131 [Penicillium brevicompactum]
MAQSPSKFVSFLTLDAKSWVKYDAGIIVAPSKEWVSITPKDKQEVLALQKCIKSALRSSRESPFIVTTKNIEKARQDAKRRAQKNHQNVRVFEIAIPKNPGQEDWVSFRKVDVWLEAAEMSGTKYLRHRRQNYLFVKRIPAAYVKEVSWRTEASGQPEGSPSGSVLPAMASRRM